MSIIKSFSVGNGDMFYIEHNSDNFTIIDCCYDTEDQREVNFEEIRKISKSKGITRFISTHPDEDHIKGLPELDKKIEILNFYVVKNSAVKDVNTDNFKKYCALRDDEKKAFYVYQGCSRKWMNESSEERGSSGINFLWPSKKNGDFKNALSEVESGTGFNNISPIFTYSMQKNVKALWMGDMEHDFQEKIKDEVDWPKVDILFAPHHGRHSSRVSSEILSMLDPQVVVIGEALSEYLDYYQGYATIKQNTAHDITFECVDSKVHVYVSNPDYPYVIDTFENLGNTDKEGQYYLGSFTPRAVD